MPSNFNNTVPSAPAGFTNVIFQTNGAGSDSAYVPSSAPISFTSLNPALTTNYNAGSAQTIFTPVAPTALRVSWSQAIDVPATTGAATSTFPSLTLGWTDVGGIARTQQLVATSVTNTTAVISQGDTIIYTNGATIVTVTSAGYTSNTAAQMTYALAIIAETI
jgi:hypothetical protein